MLDLWIRLFNGKVNDEMRNKINKNHRKYFILGLCMILVIMGVGYAAFSSQLKITGTSTIASEWIIKITDIQSTVQSGNASDIEIPAHTDTTATFKTNLISPGDSMKYDIIVENQGNIDGVLESLDVNTGSNNAITFETSGIKEGDTLLHGEKDILTVIVSYNSSVTSQPENTNSTITVTLNYKQYDGSITPPSDVITTSDLKTLAVTEGDGLYADEYEDGRYIYKGASPNNYITFNNETWRIISVESDNSLKVMKNTSVLAAWDTNNQNNWETASLNTYLNGEYLNSLSDKDKIVNRDWSVGAITMNNTDLASQIVDEKSAVWNGKVGMITASEYLKANTNMEQCGTYKLDFDNGESDFCAKTNWMYDSLAEGNSLWTITPSKVDNNRVNVILKNFSGFYGLANSTGTNITSGISVCQALYLTADITLSGDGSASNPYVITN